MMIRGWRYWQGADWAGVLLRSLTPLTVNHLVHHLCFFLMAIAALPAPGREEGQKTHHDGDDDRPDDQRHGIVGQHGTVGDVGGL